MIFLLANTVFLILSIGYAWLAGNALDRQAVVWIVVALLGTLASTALLAAHEALLAVLVIDITLFGALARIALKSERYWPTWFAGLHLAGVTCSAAAALAPAQHVDTLRTFAGFWGVPALLVMVFGLYLDRRPQAKLAVETVD